MSARKDKGRLAPFVPLIKQTLAAPAWCAMSPSARVLYIALKARYSSNIHNNGRIYLSVRQAAKETGLNKNTIARAYREMLHYGFVVMTDPGCLGVNGKGKAPHWRLTELGYMTDPPTREFMRWDGVVFSDEKKQNPVPTDRTVCTNKQDIPLSQRIGHPSTEVSQQLGHRAAPACPNEQDITSLTTPKLWTEPAAEAAAAGIGHNAGPPLDDDVGIPPFLRRTVN